MSRASGHPQCIIQTLKILNLLARTLGLTRIRKTLKLVWTERNRADQSQARAFLFGHQRVDQHDESPGRVTGEPAAFAGWSP